MVVQRCTQTSHLPKRPLGTNSSPCHHRRESHAPDQNRHVSPIHAANVRQPGRREEADHNKGEQALALLRRGAGQGRDLEALIDALPQGLGSLHVLQEEAVLLHSRHIECVGHTTHLQPIAQALQCTLSDKHARVKGCRSSECVPSDSGKQAV